MDLYSGDDHEPDAGDVAIRPIANADAVQAVTSTLTDMHRSEEAIDISERTMTSNEPAKSDDEENDEEGEGEIFKPVPILEQHKTKLSQQGLEPTAKTLGLPHELHRKWQETGYDPEWMQMAGVSEAILTSFTSKMKMDQMFIKGALKIGDELYHVGVVEGKEGVIVEKSGRVSPYYLDSRLLHNAIEKLIT